MPVNKFFNNFDATNEQQLFDKLVVESIQIFGQDMFYIPRNINNYDALYTADDQSSYTKTFLVDFYTKSVDGFGGDRDFMSKFGVEIRDQIILIVSRTTFEKEVTSVKSTIIRPREGDLIYFPLNKKVFMIRFVDPREFFYQFGYMPTYELTCELFEYSNEEFNTGIPEIDIMQPKYSTNILDYTLNTENDESILTEDGDYLVIDKYNINNNDPTNINDDIQEESDEFIDFSAIDPFAQGQI